MQLGLGVFSSGPLLQGKLLRDPSLARAAGAAPQLQAIQVRGKDMHVERPWHGTGICAESCTVSHNPVLPSLLQQGEAPRLLQLARSTPGILTALVGHKTAPHVDQNCALAQVSAPV